MVQKLVIKHALKQEGYKNKKTVQASLADVWNSSFTTPWEKLVLKYPFQQQVPFFVSFS